MLRNKCHIKKDDKVKIITGKDKGKIGKVLKVDRKKDRILVENINVVKRHTKPTAQNRQGGIVESEATIPWSIARSTGREMKGLRRWKSTERSSPKPSGMSCRTNARPALRCGVPVQRLSPYFRWRLQG